ncbi:MAG TPA: tripartite tricarboxylate transporter substrate binding protein [Burkholderiales bacterium]|nr:tripartite tricarboxylate transporter substrate binding protein [Burkholderiales bacterium]
MKKLALLGAALLASSCALAQTYPAKPIRLVTPYSPGGAGDWVARATTDRMALALGQQFVLEPRPGAGGNIAAESVVRSPADGYTLLFATPLLAINATLYRKLSFDASRDLVPIAVIATGPYVLYASGSLPIKSAGELVAMAKQKPGSINYASLGIGTGPHLGGVLLGLTAGVEFTHVPYKGFGQALPDIASGQVHFTLNGIGVADAFLKDGRVKMLGFTGLTRMKEYPDVPTVAETVPGYEVYGWYGLAAPAGTPPAIVERLNAEVAKATTSEFALQVEKRGLIPQSFSPAQTREFVARDSERWARAVKASGAKIDE